VRSLVGLPSAADLLSALPLSATAPQWFPTLCRECVVTAVMYQQLKG
jgi:hypothetical protein